MPIFDSIDAANSASTAFLRDLNELRDKHRVDNVLVALQVRVRGEDGEIGDAYASTFRGDRREQIGMAARLFGDARRDQDEMLRELTARGGRRR